MILIFSRRAIIVPSTLIKPNFQFWYFRGKANYKACHIRGNRCGVASGIVSEIGQEVGTLMTLIGMDSKRILFFICDNLFFICVIAFLSNLTLP